MTNRLLQDEELRIDTLDSFDVFGTEPEAELDEIARLAAQVCGVEAAVIALVGATRVWFKSRIGIHIAEARRERSPFDEAIAADGVYQVIDSLRDPHFGSRGIMLDGKNFRFFAGSPLIAPNGSCIGCIAVLSQNAHVLKPEESNALETIADQIMVRLELNMRIQLMESESRVRHRVESALTVERNFVSAVLDTAGALVVVMDTAGRVVRFNRACEAISGYETGAIVGRYLWETLIPVEDRAEARASFERIRNGEFPVAFENRWLAHNGDIRLIQWMATALLDTQNTKSNEVAFIIATGIDVTLQREAEETLKKSEARYRQLIESSLGMVFTHTLDGKLLSLNTYGAQGLGYSVHEMLGRSLVDFIPQEERSAFEAYLRTMREAGEAQGTMTMLHRNGQKMFIAYRNRRVAGDGSEAYALGFGVDITEKVRTEERLSALTQQSNSILESVGDGIFGMDLQGRATIINPAAAEMLGYRPEELLGSDVHALIHHSYADGSPYPVAECRMTNVVRERTPVRVSTEIFWRKDGTSIPVEYVACPIMKDGVPTGIVVAFTDTTERRALDRMKDEFISTVSHELRTPLTSMRASLGLIASGALAARPEKQKQMLEIAIGNTDRLVALVNDILELERIGSGKAELHYTMSSAEDLMKRAAGLLTGTASKAGIEFRFDAEQVDVWADPDRILQTLTNLLSNAIKFSPRGGVIFLKARLLSPDEAQLEVHDSGRGIPEDKLESIFERFQQVDASDSRAMGGTGLGLAICRSIVSQHGGRIWAESTLGKGASFFFTLPTRPSQHLS
ncbi:MAG: PAS domain S-box protein [Acidobacteria bacterium]|nr:PAS domain S-box protein [Acidobacteriota bacterium]